MSLPPFPFGNHKFVFYVCESIPVCNKFMFTSACPPEAPLVKAQRKPKPPALSCKLYAQSTGI